MLCAPVECSVCGCIVACVRLGLGCRTFTCSRVCSVPDKGSSCLQNICAFINSCVLIIIHAVIVMHGLQQTICTCAVVGVTSALQERCCKCAGTAIQLWSRTEDIAVNLLLQERGMGQGLVHLALSIGELCSSQATRILACRV